MTFDIDIVSGEVEMGVDGGFYKAVTIGNFVWHDADADGIQDAGESGLAGVTLTLVSFSGVTTDVNNNPLVPVVSDAAGMYQFTNIRPEEYEIQVTAPPMWFFSDQNVGANDNVDSDFRADGFLGAKYQFNSDDNFTNFDAGLYKNIIIIGQVWLEQDDDGFLAVTEALSGNVEVELLEGANVIATSITNATGEYMFSVKPGDYVISITSNNFGPGNTLNGVISCTPTFDPNNNIDLDDNGSGPTLGPVNTAQVSFRCGEEPDPDGVTNNTIDFCFKFDCTVPNALAAPSCGTVMDTFCDLQQLDLGCARMPSPPVVGPAPSPLCNGQGTPQNMSWFAFIAGNGNYSIEIEPFACTTVPPNSIGIQTGIYENCNFTDPIFCMATCTTSPVQIPSDVLTPGNTYFFWLDGCSGSICSYNINILGTFEIFTIPEPTEVVCTSPICSPICPNNIINLVVNSGYENLNFKFKWKITSPSGVVTYIVTDVNKLDYTPTELGIYTFEINQITNKCSNSFTTKSITIEVKHPANENFGLVKLCPDELPGYAGPVADEMNNPDPNGDLINGWQKSPFTFVAGPNVTTIMKDGCIYNQQVTIMPYVLSPPTNIREILCENEFPYLVGNEYITDATNGITTIIIDDANGCDSTINVELIKLALYGIVLEEGCVNNGFQLKFMYTELTYPGVTYEIKWKNSLGVYLNDNDPDADPTTMIVPSSGTYYVEIKMIMEGKTCYSDTPYVLNIGNLTPATPVAAVAWDDKFCADNVLKTYTATSPDGNTNFLWTYPATVTSVSGQGTSTLSILWGNSLGGNSMCSYHKLMWSESALLSNI
ncbi:MAG: hypothetical protein IPO92_06745 [Saprospiraceae bacterium]|nr:hypothetical protein [Saprospiraceae bacterium]